jgi:hypothetical protein
VQGNEADEQRRHVQLADQHVDEREDRIAGTACFSWSTPSSVRVPMRMVTPFA